MEPGGNFSAQLVMPRERLPLPLRDQCSALAALWRALAGLHATLA
jgi:hypothetical protein